jgi:high-affinity Fe2+/Pb2+ permease
MNISMMMFVATALFILGVYWTLEDDEDHVQRVITQQQDDALPPETQARRSSFDLTAADAESGGLLRA